MRKLTDKDLMDIAGSTVKGYHVCGVRVKRGEFSDSNHYGIILGKNDRGHYVTWQFHLDEDEKVNPYWGHYYGDNRDAALHDFNGRDVDSSDDDIPDNDSPERFKVTITETLDLTVEVEAEDQAEAEQIVMGRWKAGQYILGSDNFGGVEVKAVPIKD